MQTNLLNLLKYDQYFCFEEFFHDPRTVSITNIDNPCIYVASLIKDPQLEVVRIVPTPSCVLLSRLAFPQMGTQYYSGLISAKRLPRQKTAINSRIFVHKSCSSGLQCPTVDKPCIKLHIAHLVCSRISIQHCS